jgi:hypothetical protein
LEPTDDDQTVRNDITVQRTDGSSSRVTLDTGTLSTLAPPSGVGRYTDSVTLNLASDSQTLDHAGWLLHLGTWDETRYPVVKVVLSKVPGSLETAAAVDVGDRIQITNPPAWLPPDTIDLMVQGYSETLDQFTWNLDFNCTPAGPWDVAWAGDASTASSPASSVDGHGGQRRSWRTSRRRRRTSTSPPRRARVVAERPGHAVRLAGRGRGHDGDRAASAAQPNPFFDTATTGWTRRVPRSPGRQTYVMPAPPGPRLPADCPGRRRSGRRRERPTDRGRLHHAGRLLHRVMWVFS